MEKFNFVKKTCFDYFPVLTEKCDFSVLTENPIFSFGGKDFFLVMVGKHNFTVLAKNIDCAILTE